MGDDEDDDEVRDWVEEGVEVALLRCEPLMMRWAGVEGIDK